MSNNDGNTWTDIIIDNFQGSPFSIAVSPQNIQTLYVAGEEDIYRGFVYKSTDGGTSWVRVFTADNFVSCINSISIDPSNTNKVYIAADCGVYASTDLGETWNKKYTGTCYSVAISYNGDIYATGYNHIIKSSDAGLNWNVIYENSNIHFNRDCMIIMDGKLFAGTNNGLLKLEIGGNNSIPHQDNSIIENFHLYNNYPNPFNSETIIKFSVTIASDVSISIFNSLGQKIKNLTGRKYSAGEHSVKWDGKDENGNNLASDLYYYTIESGNFRKTKKMVFLK